jgi:hypothetical protein
VFTGPRWRQWGFIDGNEWIHWRLAKEYWGTNAYA